MSYKFDSNKIHISLCSDNCVLSKYETRYKEFKYEFAGASKNNTVGIKCGNSFIVEKSAESWDASIHDYGITVDRSNVVKNDIVLNKISNINHTNLLKIKSVCQCSAELEYIDGYILNTKKGEWIMGNHAYEEDYLDVCGNTELFNLFREILSALKVMHESGICHTDVMNHNIMVERKSDRPVLIDLIGAMPYTQELAALDKRNFLSHVVIDSCRRKGITISNELLELYKLNGNYEFSELFHALNLIGKL